MRVVMVHILPNFPKQILVQWELEDPDLSIAASVDYTVQRSGSPRGEWEDVATSVTTVFYTDTFEDAADDSEERSLFSLNREIWYRIKAVFSDGTELFSFPMDIDGNDETRTKMVRPLGGTAQDDRTAPLPDTLFHPNPRIRKRLQLVHRSVIRRSIIALQEFTGVRLAVLKKRKFGTRCTACWDEFSKSATYSNCSECNGTGWAGGGFYPAFPTLGRVTEGGIQAQIESEGETKLIRAKIDTINFPRLTRGDVLVEIDSNRRWEVDSVDEPRLRRRTVLQFTQCTELARTSAVYNVDATLSVPVLEQKEAPSITEQADPATFSDLLIWADNTEDLVSGAEVTTWGRDPGESLTNVVAPLAGLDTRNTLSALFTGSEALRYSADLPGLEDNTFSVVVDVADIDKLATCVLWSLGNSADNDSYLALQTFPVTPGDAGTSVFRLIGRDADGNLHTSTNVAFAGTESRVIFVLDGSTYDIYFDGVKAVDAEAFTWSVPADYDQITVGALGRSSDAFFLTGAVNAFGVYTAPLEPAEIDHIQAYLA